MSHTKKNMTEFIRFLTTSGFAALVNIVARIGFSKFLIYEWAVFLAYLVGMLTAYILTRRFVFAASGRSVKYEMSGFIFVNIVAIIQVWVVSIVLYKWALPQINWTYRPELIAHICGVISPAFTSYFGHKYISFRKKKPGSPE